MLKLFDPVRYTPDEKSFINTALKPKGEKAWACAEPTARAIKHHISEHTIIAQKGRCAYCERVLAGGDVEIEHIAPKNAYEEFTFEPYNLVSSCSCCNAPGNKGQKKIIIAPVNKTAYDNNTFSIVHPYFDNPDDHIKYKDQDRTIFDLKRCSPKGMETIKLFNWDTYWALLKRLEIASMRHHSIDALKLAAEIATYK
jgi:uncharacterized protein (TIGR02646 family)